MTRGARVAALLVPLALYAPASLAGESALDEAKALVSRATVEYNVGRFDQALELYTQAYEKYSKPALLFNIGQCHRLLAHYERALFFYHGYLREQPEATNRPLVEQRIEESQRALDAQRAAEADAARARAAQPVAPVAQPAPAPVTTTMAPAPAVISAPADSGEHTTTSGSPAVWIAGLATTGVGVALIGTGIGFGLHAESVSNELTQLSGQKGAWSTHYQSEYDSGKSAATTANILIAAGAVAVAGGAVLTWVGWPKSKSASVAYATPVPGGVAAGVTGSF